ncbi:MAG: thiamine biosynthesis protein ThiF, partial [Deltaproteobacteria bacterium]
GVAEDLLEGRGSPPLRRWVVFCLCAVLFICSQFYRVSNAIIAPQLQRDLGLSPESLGLLTALFFYTFALVQLPLGPCLDRIGARRSMAALTIVGSVGAWIFASAKGLEGAALGRVLLGAGMAANLMGSMKLFTTWFSPREFATLSGLIIALGTIGNMVAATPLALLVEALGWRWSFATIGGFTALLAILFYALVREGPYGVRRQEEMAPSIGEMARTLLGRREYWIISLSTFLRYGIFVAIQGLWVGPYLMEVVGLSAVQAGNLLLILNVGLIIGSPLSGWISDRVLSSRKKVVMAGLVGMALSLLVLAMGWASGSTPLLAGVLFTFGLSSGAGIVMYAHIKELMPGAMTGVALTGVNLFTMLGGGFFLHLMGWVLERLSGGGPVGPEAYRAAFLIGVAGLVVAFSLYIRTREEHS